MLFCDEALMPGWKPKLPRLLPCSRPELRSPLALHQPGLVICFVFFEGFGSYLGISHPTHQHLGKLSIKKRFFETFPRYVKSYANKDSCAAMLHCCFAASEMAFSESSQPPLLHCIATSLQSHIKWQSELKQYNSRCFVALLQYYIRCQSELKADPATSLLCYNLCQPEHNTSLAASLLRCNLI